MSQRPIARSDDLQRLRADGYTLVIRGGKLVVSDVPFVDQGRGVREDGSLVMSLALAGETTTAPSDHTAYFVGGVPCNTQGQPLSKIINNVTSTDLGDGLVASCYFSAKPHGRGNYTNYYEKVTTYVGHISAPAAALRPDVTARRFRPAAATDEDAGPFRYIDTASSRVGIEAINARLASEGLAIVGLGGSGEYILDYVAKTPVPAIHLFDGDRFYTHNAFRAPGAPSLEQLEARPLKVEHFAALYGNMHGGIVQHPYPLGESNVAELESMTFVFVAIDDAPAKRPIIAALDRFGIPYIDVGMGVTAIDGRLTGIVRTTLSTPSKNDHVPGRIAMSDTGAENDYRSNVQIAELNAYNAAAAVIRWKKFRGVYADLGCEHNTTYSIATNHVVNEDQA